MKGRANQVSVIDERLNKIGCICKYSIIHLKKDF